MESHSALLIFSVVAGFFMAWGIGANDVSNAMGTSVGSKAITIRQAIVIAAIFEFLGAFLAGSEVTNTIRKDLLDPALFQDTPYDLIYGMLASLLAAGVWLIVASLCGWPVSTTHTIVGAIIGFGAMQVSIDAIQWTSVTSIILAWIFSPCLGGVIAYCLFSSTQRFIFNQPSPIESAKKVVPLYILLASWVVNMITFFNLGSLGIHLSFLQVIGYSLLFSVLFYALGRVAIQRLQLNPDADRDFHFANVEKIFAILMVFTACAMAFAHGSNDVANAVGPVAAIVGLLSTETLEIQQQSIVPMWILLVGACGIVIGLVMYGHKVIATVGTRITQLTPSRGFSATLSAAITVVLASGTGLPISTTHTLVGAILGVGLARGIDALNLNVVRNIFISWVVTLPAGALLAVFFFHLLKSLWPQPVIP